MCRGRMQQTSIINIEPFFLFVELTNIPVVDYLIFILLNVGAMIVYESNSAKTQCISAIKTMFSNINLCLGGKLYSQSHSYSFLLNDRMKYLIINFLTNFNKKQLFFALLQPPLPPLGRLVLGVNI
jgi:hypothetical protein